MTIDEAIKNLKWLLPAPENYEKALALGIEALERIKHLREEQGRTGSLRYLPSETEGVNQ